MSEKTNLNFSARHVSQEAYDFCQQVREKHGFSNDTDVLEWMVGKLIGMKGQPKPAPQPEKPAEGKNVFSAKLTSKDWELAEKVRDFMFEKKNLESNSQILREMLRLQVAVQSERLYLVDLPEKWRGFISDKLEAGRKEGKVRESSDVFKIIFERAEDFGAI